MKQVLVVLAAVTVTLGACSGATNRDVRVTVDRANLRARPAADSEVVAQVCEGAVLRALREEGEWLLVPAPTNVEVWAKAEFVKEGVAVSDRVNLRCGPGVSYRNVGVLAKGARVRVVEARGEWLRVAAPEGLTVWISSKVVAAAEAPAVAGRPAPVTPAAAAATTVPAAPAATATVQAAGVPLEEPVIVTGRPVARALPAGISSGQLAAVLGQGAVIEREGILERIPLAALRGREFRLVAIEDNEKTTVCQLRGNEAQMKTLVGRRLSVKGRGFWLKGDNFPVIFPDTLEAGSIRAARE